LSFPQVGGAYPAEQPTCGGEVTITVCQLNLEFIIPGLTDHPISAIDFASLILEHSCILSSLDFYKVAVHPTSGLIYILTKLHISTRQTDGSEQPPVWDRQLLGIAWIR
jgi:hypothetical protein